MVKRTGAKIIEDLKGKNFEDEIKNDQEKSAMYIRRAADAERILGADYHIAQHEKQAVELYKRLLLLITVGGVEIHNSDKKIDGADNNLPAASYLSHGSRLLTNTGTDIIKHNKIVNWIVSEDQNNDGRSKKQNQIDALKEGKIVYNRSAATHDVKIIKNEDGGFIVKEIKQPLAKEAMNWVAGKLGGETKHYGSDLAMNAEFGKQDPDGIYVDRPDGDHGHIYMHCNEPTDKENKNILSNKPHLPTPGSILIGNETGSAESSKHSILGRSEVESPTGGSKFPELAKKLAEYNKKWNVANPYKDTVIPQQYNGMTMKIDSAKLDFILNLKAEDYGAELAYIKPCKSLKDFANNLAEAKKEMIANQKSDEVKVDDTLFEKADYLKRQVKELEPNLLIKVLNVITFGFAFREKCDRHLDAMKEYVAATNAFQESIKERREETKNSEPTLEISQEVEKLQPQKELGKDSKSNLKSSQQPERQLQKKIISWTESLGDRGGRDGENRGVQK